MSTFNNSRLPPPQDPREFEKMLVAAAKIRWNNTNFSLNGRPGQKQNGVDVFGTMGNVAGIGIQCKNTIYKLTEKLIRSEIDEAKNFDPQLNKLYIATTLNGDSSIQEIVRKCSSSNESEGLFGISIMFWEEIVGELTKDQQILFQFYPELKLNSEREQDQRVLSLIQRILPFNGFIGEIRSSPFLGKRYVEKKLEQLNEFYHTFDNPELRFISPKLEYLRLNLRQQIGEFLGKLGTYYTSVPNSVYAELHNYNEEQRKIVISKLESLSNNVVQAYDELFNPVYLHSK